MSEEAIVLIIIFSGICIAVIALYYLLYLEQKAKAALITELLNKIAEAQDE